MTKNVTVPGFYDPITNVWSAEKPDVTYNDQRISEHQKLAVLEPGDLGLGQDYPTLQEVHKVEGAEPTYAFYGSFWAVFRDVMNIACQRIHLNTRRSGFWPNNDTLAGSLKLAIHPETHGRNVGEVLALMTSEHSEALDAMRSGGLNQMDDKLPHRSGVYTEVVDAIIRGFDFLGGMMADAGSIFVEKQTFNKSRPALHGRKF